MKVFPSRGGFLVRLEMGENVHAALCGLAADHGLRGGALTGIGAVERAELGAYELHERRYVRYRVEETTELVSFTANLALRDGEPFLHAHALLSRPDGTVIGGHLFDATVAITAEFSVTHTDLNLVRVQDEGVGLALLEPGV